MYANAVRLLKLRLYRLSGNLSSWWAPSTHDGLTRLRQRFRDMLTPFERRLVNLYDVVPGERPKMLSEFLAGVRPIGHPMSLTERCMYRAALGAAALRAGLRAEHPAIIAAGNKAMSTAPETNYAGD